MEILELGSLYLQHLSPFKIPMVYTEEIDRSIFGVSLESILIAIAAWAKFLYLIQTLRLGNSYLSYLTYLHTECVIFPPYLYVCFKSYCLR